MKKVLAAVVVLCFTATGFAAWGIKKPETKTADAKVSEKETKKERVALTVVTGVVTSINEPQNELVVKDDATTYDKVLVVKPDVYKTVKIGDTVEAKIESGTNVADSIKVTKVAPVEKIQESQTVKQPNVKPEKKNKEIGDVTKGDTSQHKI